MRRHLSYAPLLALLFVTACDRSDEPSADAREEGARPVVATTFFPTAWLVERLAGDAVEVVLPLPGGEDPIFWQPSREALERYQAADLIVINGAELEKWVTSASLPLSRVVDTAAGFRDRWLEFEGRTHVHGGGSAHSHVGVDGHTWMSPELFEAQAEAVAEALTSRGLAPADAVAAELKSLRADLQGLQRTLEEDVVPAADGVRVLANHPAYDYLLGGRVDLVNLDLDPTSTDVAAALDAVRPALGGAGRSVLLWEAEPTRAVAAALEDQLGVTSVEFSPAENVDDPEADFVAIQRENLSRLLLALGR